MSWSVHFGRKNYPSGIVCPGPQTWARDAFSLGAEGVAGWGRSISISAEQKSCIDIYD